MRNSSRSAPKLCHSYHAEVNTYPPSQHYNWQVHSISKQNFYLRAVDKRFRLKCFLCSIYKDLNEWKLISLNKQDQGPANFDVRQNSACLDEVEEGVRLAIEDVVMEVTGRNVGN